MLSLVDIKMMTLLMASMREYLISSFANTKGADQPVHLCSMVSDFMFRYLEKNFVKLVPSKMSIF